jgi:hypothetical protein
MRTNCGNCGHIWITEEQDNEKECLFHIIALASTDSGSGYEDAFWGAILDKDMFCPFWIPIKKERKR